ncbi:MAG: YiiX/YebB-like N1pC/P60 family cysteine hydrolase [Thiotrichaceae bacterium]|nr:YiiX/YebB-like N1pC/P60 family cysteine hydrolase [Thiotrichaceae bacterium]
MANYADRVLQQFLIIFGGIKVFRFPFFMIYDPRTFAIKGKQTREVMNLLQPGDILLRTYKNYLDGYFIPGTFSHAGFYLGKVTDDDVKNYSGISNSSDLAEIETGDEMVIHSMARGIFLEDVINFCRCDGMAVLRFPHQLKHQAGLTVPQRVQEYFNSPEVHGQYGKEPILAEQALATRLLQGETLDFAKEVFPLFFHTALSQLGKPYDFDFNFDDFNAMSCTEFVYFLSKSVCWNYGIQPVEKKVLFKSRRIIQPDAFENSALSVIWKQVQPR